MKKLIILLLCLIMCSNAFAGTLRVDIEYKDSYKQQFIDSVKFVFAKHWRIAQNLYPAYTDEQLYNEAIKLLLVSVEVNYRDCIDKKAISNESIAEPYE